MKLYSINSSYFKPDGGAMFGVVPKSGLPSEGVLRTNPSEEGL